MDPSDEGTLEQIATIAETSNEQHENTSVNSSKRKHDDTNTSPDQVGEKASVPLLPVKSPYRKKRILITKGKKVNKRGRGKGVASILNRISATQSDGAIVGDDDDDYDTADEQPLSGLVPNYPTPNAKVPKSRGQRGRRRALSTRGGKLASPLSTTNEGANNAATEIMEALAEIRTDIAQMKINGNNLDLKLSTVTTTVNEHREESITKAEFDDALRDIMVRTNEKVAKNREQIHEQRESLVKHTHQIDEINTILNVHDTRITNLEKDITDDLIHFKKRMQGLEDRMAQSTPEPQIMKSATVTGTVNQQTQHMGEGTLPQEGKSSANKNIIIEGLCEYPLENLEEVVFEMLNEIGIKMTESDYNKMVRLGRWNSAKNWPRPIKVELLTDHKKNKIYANRDNLKNTQDYYNVKINLDEPKLVRIGKAMLRQAAKKARDEGKRVYQNPYSIDIDGETFTIETIRSRNVDPSKPLPQPNQEKPQDRNKPQGSAPNHTTRDDVHKKYAEDLCQLDTPFGLAFFTIRTKLSNFYPCKIHYNGRDYQNLEQGYQAEKAVCAKDHVRLTRILKATTAKEAKDIGREITSTITWNHIKLDRMRGLLYAKFSQNRELGDYLCSLKTIGFIEGSVDSYWGAGVPLNSKRLINGDWYGRNELGRLLEQVRDDLRRERSTQVQKEKCDSVPPLQSATPCHTLMDTGIEDQVDPKSTPVQTEEASLNDLGAHTPSKETPAARVPAPDIVKPNPTSSQTGQPVAPAI